VIVVEERWRGPELYGTEGVREMREKKKGSMTCVLREERKGDGDKIDHSLHHY